MKFKSFILLISLMFLLTACGSKFSDYEPIVVSGANEEEGYKPFLDEEIFELYKSKNQNGETISKMLFIEMDGEHKGKELFVLSNTEEDTFFRVFNFDKKKQKFKKILEEKTYYDKNRPFFVQGVAPFQANETEHIFIGQYLNPKMHYYFLVIGKTPSTESVEILIDNATKENAIGIFNGGIEIGDRGFTILEDAGFYESYTQTATGYEAMKNKLQ